jgi:RNA polymerase sigma factor (TIGR02999 family)
MMPVIPASDASVEAADLLPMVYGELRRLAVSKMAREAPDHTLQPTALVHEAWIRLAGPNSRQDFATRAQFFAAAAEAMRRILIERARRKSALKRGGSRERIDLDSVELAEESESETLLLVSEALDKLEQHDPRTAEIVKLRFFAGLTLEEAGGVMGFTERTAKRYWAYARAWLYDELRRST